jgi:hypothetical protein
MVHNLVDGLPIEAVVKLKELETANGALKFGFIGIEGFEERIFGPQTSPHSEIVQCFQSLNTKGGLPLAH